MTVEEKLEIALKALKLIADSSSLTEEDEAEWGQYGFGKLEDGMPWNFGNADDVFDDGMTAAYYENAKIAREILKEIDTK